MGRELEMNGSHPLRVALTAAAGALAWLLLAAQAAEVAAPPGWQLVGYPEGFEIRLDVDGGRGGTKCVRIHGREPEEGRWAGVGQIVEADPWQGRRLRLSAWLRAEGVKEWGGLYLRVDDRLRKPMAFGNNRRAPVDGTAGWRRYEVVLDVPPDAARVAFGVHLNGRGLLWADDFSLEIVEGR